MPVSKTLTTVSDDSDQVALRVPSIKSPEITLEDSRLGPLYLACCLSHVKISRLVQLLENKNKPGAIEKLSEFFEFVKSPLAPKYVKVLPHGLLYCVEEETKALRTETLCHYFVDFIADCVDLGFTEIQTCVAITIFKNVHDDYICMS